MGLLGLGIRAACYGITAANRRSEDRNILIVNQAHGHPTVEQAHPTIQQTVPVRSVNQVTADQPIEESRLNKKAFKVIGIITLLCSIIAFVANLVGYLYLQRYYNRSTRVLTTTHSPTTKHWYSSYDYNSYDYNRKNSYQTNIQPWSCFNSWSGAWCTAFYIVTGSLAIATAHYKKQDYVVATLVMAIFSVLAAGVMMLISVVDVAIFAAFTSPQWLSAHNRVHEAMAALMLSSSIIVGVSHIVLSVFCCKASGNCCHDGTYASSTVQISTVTLPSTTVRPHVQAYAAQQAGYQPQPLVHQARQPGGAYTATQMAYPPPYTAKSTSNA